MSHWIYLLRPVRPAMVDEPSEEEMTSLSAHYAHLERLTAEGTVILAGPSWSDSDTFGLVVLDIEGEQVARSLMESDPAITGGVMTGELRPLRMTFLRDRR